MICGTCKLRTIRNRVMQILSKFCETFNTLDSATYDQHDCRMQTTAQMCYYSTVLFCIKITGSCLKNIIIKGKG